MSEPSRKYIDIKRYIESTQTTTCFLCEIARHNPEYSHHIIYEDDQAIAFLNKYPILEGDILVAPREHREQVTGDFTPDEYLDLQHLIYQVTEAIRQEVSTERVYIFSFGSHQQGNRHVHWHVAPLPLGVPYEQQFQAVMLENGVLDIPQEDLADLAARIGRRIAFQDADFRPVV